MVFCKVAAECEFIYSNGIRHLVKRDGAMIVFDKTGANLVYYFIGIFGYS